MYKTKQYYVKNSNHIHSWPHDKNGFFYRVYKLDVLLIKLYFPITPKSMRSSSLNHFLTTPTIVSHKNEEVEDNLSDLWLFSS